MVLGKQGKNNVHPSKAEVGEIDTSSPFESVKQAVSLFGAVAFTRRRTQLSGRKPRTQSYEKLSAKESRLHLANKELNKLKDNLQQTDLTRRQALKELESVKKTIEELTRELSMVSKSKDVENAQTKGSSSIFDRTLSSCRRELDTFTVKYLTASLEVNEAKKELGKLRLDYDSESRSYNDLLRQSLEAKAASKANNEAAIELTKKISGMNEIILHTKAASPQAKEKYLEIETSRKSLRHEYKTKLCVLAEALESLKKKLDTDTAGTIQKKLDSTYDQGEALKQDIRKAQDSYSELSAMLALELDNEKAILQKLHEEENFLREMIDSLELELENMKKEVSGMNVKEDDARRLVEDLEAELHKNKLDLENCILKESKVKSKCDQMKETMINLLNETRRARQEAKDTTLEAEAVMNEAEADRNLIKESEAKLQLLMKEAEAARSAEAEALERVKLLSESKLYGPKVTVSNKEFSLLSIKINDSVKLADMEVSVAMVQVEVDKAFQNESYKILEASQKKLEELRLATLEALKVAEEAEADKAKLEAELKSLDSCIVNKAEDVLISDTTYEMEMEKFMSCPNGISKSSSTSSASRRRVTLGEMLKMDGEGSVKSRRTRMRSLSGIFNGM